MMVDYRVVREIIIIEARCMLCLWLYYKLYQYMTWEERCFSSI